MNHVDCMPVNVGRNRWWRWIMTLVFSLVFISIITMLAIQPVSAKPLLQDYDITQQCFAVAEERELGAGKQDSRDTLVRLDRTNGQTFVIGETGTLGIEAIAMGPDGILYAVDADRLGTLDLVTGQFTPKPQLLGIASGLLGNIRLHDADGLYYDNSNQIWYATLRRSATDLLFQVAPSTGAHIPNAFGVGQAYVEVPAVLDSNNLPLRDVDGIAVDPVSGVMFATINQSGTGGVLATIDKRTGAASKIGEFHYPTPYPANPALAGQVVDDIEGLSFFNDGQLYGSTGDNGPDDNDKNKLFRIDKTNALATYLGDFPAGLVDYEGLACQTAQAFITLQKFTNGPMQPPADADLPPGPQITVGQPVTWTYILINTGVLTLTEIVLRDDQLGLIGPGGASNCPPSGQILAPGQSFTCTAQGIAQAGQYANMGVVTATTQEGLITPRQTVTSSNPSHYFGAGPGIAIKKFTNGADADDPNGGDVPQLLPGAPVTWTYQVSNIGNVALAADKITVTDSQLGITPLLVPTSDVGGDGLLSPGEVWLYQAVGRAIDLAAPPAGISTVSGCNPAGTSTTRTAYVNIATVSIDTVIATDPSHYCNPVPPVIPNTPGIVIKKFTNGPDQLPEDADTPTGPAITVGSPVTWTYIVTNTGDVPLSNVTVSDDQNVTVSCPKTLLAPGERMICLATGIAILGQYVNTGRVIGTPPTGTTVQDDDRSHYLGVSLALASVGDFVWNDSLLGTANGIQEPNEPGIANVLVTLFSADGTQMATQITDANGRYRFDNLQPGSYYLAFGLPIQDFTGIVPKNQGADRQRDSNIDPTTKRTEIFTLQAGQIDLSQDAGVLIVPRSLEPGEEPSLSPGRIFLPLIRQ